MFDEIMGDRSRVIAVLGTDKLAYINSAHLIEYDQHVSFRPNCEGDVVIQHPLEPDKSNTLAFDNRSPQGISDFLHSGDALTFQKYFQYGYLSHAWQDEDVKKEFIGLAQLSNQYIANLSLFRSCKISETYCTPETIAAIADITSAATVPTAQPHPLFQQLHIPIKETDVCRYNKLMTILDHMLKDLPHNYSAKWSEAQNVSYEKKAQLATTKIQSLFRLIQDAREIEEFSEKQLAYIVFALLYNFDTVLTSDSATSRVFTKELSAQEITEQQQIIATKLLISKSEAIRTLSDEHRAEIHQIVYSNEPGSKKLLDICKLTGSNLSKLLVKYKCLAAASIHNIAALSLPNISRWRTNIVSAITSGGKS